MVKQRQSVVTVCRSKYLYEKNCKTEQGTKRKGVKKSNSRAQTTVEIQLPF